MNETKELLERVGDRFAFPEDALVRLERRRDRKRRNQRIAAAVVGIAVFVAAVVLVTNSAFDRTAQEPGAQLDAPSRAPIPIGKGSADGWGWLLSTSADGACVALTDAQGSHVNCTSGPSPLCQGTGVACPSDFVFDGAYYSPRPPAPDLVFAYGRVPPSTSEVELDIRATGEPTRGRVFDAPSDVGVDARFFVEWVGGYPYPVIPGADLIAKAEGTSDGISTRIERPSWARVPSSTFISTIASGALPADSVYQEEPWRIVLFRSEETGQLCLGRPQGGKVCGPEEDPVPAWLDGGSDMRLIGGYSGGMEPFVRILAWGIIRDPIETVGFRQPGHGTDTAVLYELPARYGKTITVFVWACSGPDCHHGSLLGLDADGSVRERVD